MKEEVIALRVEPKLKREVELLCKVLHISAAEWIRTRLAYNIKEVINDLKYQIVTAYLKGELLRDELEELFGESLAKDIDFIIEKTRKDLLKSEKIAKQLKK
ncbi:MAG: hypothetical protein QMD21_07435 [Candidatus Thermoplasmatota archaeon]|nr:hypothetical protein [Candidatus Thermoplasmatota archaeon]